MQTHTLPRVMDMKIGLILAAGWLLVRSDTAMDAAALSCRLFVTGVLPGLLPYMVVTLMLLSRLKRPLRPWQLVLMGWCGGSPCGARLLREAGDMPHRQRMAAACATMSPMFLLGTLGRWLGSSRAGMCILLANLSGALLASLLLPREAGDTAPLPQPEPLSLGTAVEDTARTLLTVCGIMAVMRVAAALLGEALVDFPAAALIVTALLEVTAGAEAIVSLPLPLPLRTALIAGATGLGGASLLMQNRAVLRVMSLTRQLAVQVVHGGLTFLLALGMMAM